MIKVADIARNKWRSILVHLGLPEACLTGKHCACPLCGGTDRFRFDDKEGRGTYFCNACGAGDGAKLAMEKHGWSFAELAERVRAIAGEVAEQPGRRQADRGALIGAMRAVLDASVDISPGDEVSRYLAGRGLSGPYPEDLRFVRALRVTDHPARSTLPAMIGLVRRPDGKGASIHRTYLENAAKANMPSPRKMMAGTLPKGSVIRLGAHAGILGIAEGIETALAVRADFAMPCWAACNAGMLADFEWPEDVTELHVFGDNDPKFGGQAAAYRLGHRAATARCPVRVEVHIPPAIGADWLSHRTIRQAA